MDIENFASRGIPVKKVVAAIEAGEVPHFEQCINQTRIPDYKPNCNGKAMPGIIKCEKKVCRFYTLVSDVTVVIILTSSV